MSGAEARRPDRWPDAGHTDLVVQLRRHAAIDTPPPPALLHHAADEIERLRARPTPTGDAA